MERRINDTPIGDTARILALLYTVGFFAFVFVVTIKGVPSESKDIVNQLIGIMSVILVGVMKFYFDGTRQAEVGQHAAVVGRAQADATIQEIARTVPASIPLAVSAAPIDTSQQKGST